MYFISCRFEALHSVGVIYLMFAVEVDAVSIIRIVQRDKLNGTLGGGIISTFKPP